jgi:hypothetical protein
MLVPIAHAKKSKLNPRCQQLLSTMSQAMANDPKAPQLLAQKSQAESDVSAAMKQNKTTRRQTTIIDKLLLERVLMDLARGGQSVDEIVAIMTPLRKTVFEQAGVIKRAALEIEKLKQAPQIDDAAIAQQLYFMELASIPFGQNYGQYMMLQSLIEAVADGMGANYKQSEIPIENPTAAAAGTSRVIFDLAPNQAPGAKEEALQSNAVLAAKRTRGILNSKTEDFPIIDGVPWNPNLEELHILFITNIYAKLAKLQQDLDREEELHSNWLVPVGWWANLVLSSPIQYLPEKARQVLLALTGLQYDKFVMRKYLHNVQDALDVVRERNGRGQIVLSSDPVRIDLLIKTIAEADKNSNANDFLITFARIGYQVDMWAEMMTKIKEKALLPDGKNQLDPDSRYTLLYNRLLDAQKRAASLNGLPYTYEPEVASRVLFALAQSGWFGSAAGSGYMFLAHYLTHLSAQLN